MELLEALAALRFPEPATKREVHFDIVLRAPLLRTRAVSGILAVAP